MLMSFYEEDEGVSIEFKAYYRDGRKTIRKLYEKLRDEHLIERGEKLEKMMEDKNESTDNQ